MRLLNPSFCLPSFFLFATLLQLSLAITTKKGQSLSAEAKNISADTKAPHAPLEDAMLCQKGTLDPKQVKGKILFCPSEINARVAEGDEARLAGAVERPSVRHLLFLELVLEQPNRAMNPGMLRDLMECLLECVTKLREMLKSVAAVEANIIVLVKAVEIVLKAVRFLIT